MTSKEKAVQLFNKYYVSILEINNDLSEEIIISILAKKHALIAVTEILELTGGHINQFYQKVKNELSNL
jgi:hypothetical protein